MSDAAEWLSTPQAARLAGCPVTTIEYYLRQGRITNRPNIGRRPTLNAASVELFAQWWRQEQAERAARRSRRDTPKEAPSEPGWLNAAQAAELLGRSSNHMPWLAHHGHVEGRQFGRRWWFREDSVARYAAARRDWVSWETAAGIVGCSTFTIAAAVKDGRIRRRQVHRTLASLERASVERFAEHWTTEQAARKARRAMESPVPGPPRDGNVWLDASTAALVLRVSTARVRQLARAERLPAVLASGRWWFRREYVEQAAAIRARQPRPPAQTQGRGSL